MVIYHHCTTGDILTSCKLFYSKKIPSRHSSSSAFTLIEVIFAIVIMSIIIVSLPVVMGSNQKGIDTTIVQEAIFGASAELNQVLSYRWDENSLDKTNNPFGLAKVIETGDCNNTDTSLRYRLRPGHIAQPLHRRCLELTATLVTPEVNFGLESEDIDDIDDINISSKSMFINAGSATGYKQDFKSNINITYATIGTILDTNQDAKRIEITVKDGNTVITRLRSYTLNIGEVDIYKKRY